MKDEIDVLNQLKVKQANELRNATDERVLLNKAEYKLKERQFRKQEIKEDPKMRSIFQRKSHRRVASATYTTTPRSSIRQLINLK